MTSAIAMLREARELAAAFDIVPSAELVVIEAVDFVTGGLADFARAADGRGSVIGAWQIAPGEERSEFLERVRREARGFEARRLVIGGVPDLTGRPDPAPAPRPVSHSVVAMPDGALHPGQIAALRVIQANRFAAIRAGRRFGKTSLCAALAVDAALLGGIAGLFAPIYKLASPLFDILAAALAPVIASANRSFGELRLVGGGGCDVWSLEHPRAGRGRRYNLVVVDEAAHGGPELTSTWSASIRPCLADTEGPAIIASTPNGVAETNFFWLVCNEKDAYGFAEFVAPTLRNPFIPVAEIEALRLQHNPLVFSQEFEAQFVNLAGAGLFDISKMLNQGGPWETPEKFDAVFATVDSGMRGGSEHDASAVVYFGLNGHLKPLGLYVLDWETTEAGAGDIELWFANIGRRLKSYAENAVRIRSWGVHVERAGLGEMLVAKANALGVYATEIKSEIVARGKDLRALAADPLINGGMVKLTKSACDRASRLKGVSRNHLLAQVAGFRTGDKEAWRRADDLVDALVYGVLVAYKNE